jgi:hypothetical protein
VYRSCLATLDATRQTVAVMSAELEKEKAIVDEANAVL